MYHRAARAVVALAVLALGVCFVIDGIVSLAAATARADLVARERDEARARCEKLTELLAVAQDNQSLRAERSAELTYRAYAVTRKIATGRYFEPWERDAILNEYGDLVAKHWWDKMPPTKQQAVVEAVRGVAGGMVTRP